MNKLIFIVGPTATGKSDLAFRLAKKVKGEIISCDSMLIYKEPSIITSKPSPNMLKEIKHHFVNIISVKDTYNVFTYFKDAKNLIEKYFGKIPLIICGGTGLYFKAILDGIFEGISSNEELRTALKKEAELKGKEYLYNRLKEVDPITAEKVSPNDLKRIIRALEVYYLSGAPISLKQKESRGLWKRFPMKIFGLYLPRAILYDRINNRVEKMFAEGAVEEVARIRKISLSITASKIIGIREISLYLDGKVNLEEAKEMMKKNTRHFAKRQITWFKRDNRIEWINVENKSVDVICEEILKNV